MLFERRIEMPPRQSIFKEGKVLFEHRPSGNIGRFTKFVTSFGEKCQICGVSYGEHYGNSRPICPVIVQGEIPRGKDSDED